MWQVLILISVILLVYIISRITKNSNKFISQTSNEIVKCLVCGLNTPVKESINQGKDWFCSKECISRNDI